MQFSDRMISKMNKNRQGCVMSDSPRLFNVQMDGVVHEVNVRLVARERAGAAECESWQV